MKVLKKALSISLAVVISVSLLVVGFTTEAAQTSFSSTPISLTNMVKSANKRGSKIIDLCSYKDSVLTVTPGDDATSLNIGNKVSYDAYLTLINGSTVYKEASGCTRAFWIKYRVKKIGDGGYAQLGFGTSTATNGNWSETNVAYVGEKHTKATPDVVNSVAFSKFYGGATYDYRLLVAGAGCEIEILEIKFATIKKTGYYVASYHIGNDFMLPVFLTNEAPTTQKLNGAPKTVSVWYDKNDNVFNSTITADISLYDTMSEALGKREITSGGVYWYSDTKTDSFASGNGTKSNPYIITNDAQLRYAVASGTAGQYYKLGNDIVINDTTTSSLTNSRGLKNWIKDGANFTLESNEASAFSGNFDGAGHTVRGLYIDFNDSAYNGGLVALGLFPNVSGATVKNLKLEDVYIKSNILNATPEQAYGAIVGKNAGNGTVIENVLVKNVSVDAFSNTAPSGTKNVGISAVLGINSADLTVKDLISDGFTVSENYKSGNYKVYAGGIFGFALGNKTLNASNILVYDAAPISCKTDGTDILEMSAVGGNVTNVFAIGNGITLNKSFSTLKLSSKDAFYGDHKVFASGLNGSANWLSDKCCYLPMLSSFASEQTFKHGETLPGTCTHGDYCEICGEVFNNNKNPDNHINVKTRNGVPYTCDMIGFEGEFYCADCGLSFGEGQSLDALGHDWGDWVVTTEPTTSNAGAKMRACKREGCSFVETEEIPPIGVTVPENTPVKREVINDKKTAEKIKSTKAYTDDKDDDDSELSVGKVNTAKKSTVIKEEENSVLRLVLLIAIPVFIIICGIVLLLILSKKRK